MSSSGKNQVKSGKGVLSWLAWTLLILVVLLTVFIRLRLLDVPLERDEGEYAYAGQLILDGVMPYAQAYNMKMPGIYFAYAGIEAVFGQTCRGVRIGALVLNVATILMLFFFARDIFGPVVGLASATAFGLLSLGTSVQGIMANAEHFVILPAVAGVYCLVAATRRQHPLLFWASGLLLGTAFLMKQHGIAFIAFAGLYLCIVELRRKPFKKSRFAERLGVFALGVILPFAVICVVLWCSGVFDRFWFWTFQYACEYVSSVPLSAGLEVLALRLKVIAGSAAAIWILAGVGAAGTLLNPTLRKRGWFVWGFVLFSFLAICPGFYFRPHYFILLLPAVSLLAGCGFGGLTSLCNRAKLHFVKFLVPAGVAVLVLFFSIYPQRQVLFQLSPIAVSRMMYGANPFPESLEIARFIKDNSSEDDTVAVIGSEPQIYFYADRRSATGYIYTYALMEPHQFAAQMQEEMIAEIEAANPKFLLFINVPASWLVRPESDRTLFDWFGRHHQEYYEVAGIADIFGDAPTVYRWNEDAMNYSPRSPCWVGIYRRKGQ